MRSRRVYLPDLMVEGQLLALGYAVSLVSYTDLGVRYEVYMDNEDYILLEEDEDGL